jgi:hypothetical protein
MTNTFTVQQILALPMGDNDANATTIGDYFARLAERAWVEEEGFSGKRPFGNSGWQHEVYHALVTHKVITGEIDEYGYVEDYDGHAADQILKEVLQFLLKIDWAKTVEYREPEDWYVVLLDRSEGGSPEIRDLFAVGFTEKVAKERVASRKDQTDSGVWTAIRIPE